MVIVDNSDEKSADSLLQNRKKTVAFQDDVLEEMKESTVTGKDNASSAWSQEKLMFKFMSKEDPKKDVNPFTEKRLKTVNTTTRNKT